ncbi:MULTISPECIES: hypothetical protein [Streptomyces]|uniref:Lipoprotein n=1 Tax=Streptomyces doudnae TaxID=3075536 RepID=A0ABD5EHJ2_9ACTN|nr:MULTISPECIES: hypothetical protein [unclassified Streptomyces]MDT0433499.1 hypothetical protein [Streptomyces sp. DSM 41981]MYQ65490.1 hypothetical protein [Streptomyces sp. SID4950]SCE01002.1 hypothetical protein GA0115242_119437 [Streptomyces sp. SolWspMP-5a-2]
MRAIRVASAVLLGAGALTFSAPAAVANGGDHVTPFGFSVQPRTIAAGGQLTLRLDRDRGGCKGPARVSSGVFDTVTIEPGRSSATTTVDWDARAEAEYQVTFMCDGMNGSTEVTIAGGRGDHDRGDHDRGDHDRGDHGRDDYRDPYYNRGVHAGEGGSVAGFDLKELGLGAALVAGSVGAAYHFSRRRSGEDAG